MEEIKPFEEQQYIDFVQTILSSGTIEKNRTKTDAITLFASPKNVLSFDLSNGKIPLLTTKKLFWRGVVEELIFFIYGKTNSKELSDKGVKIWDKNGSREFLDSIGLKERPEGDLGPIYSHQWRHFGAEYKGCNEDYSGRGIDQLQEAIDLIKKDPKSRRIIVSAWNPNQLKEMVLPPCHMIFQFHVTEKGGLECALLQRSSDVGLGLPFNIASYSLLTHLIAEICGLKAEKFTIFINNAHIYLNHVEPLKEQCKRTILNDFPFVSFKGEIKSLDDIKSEKIKLFNYFPQSPIKMEMSE